MKTMSTLVLLLAAAILPARSQETNSNYLDKAEHDALLDLCSQKWFADLHADKCQPVKGEVDQIQKQKEEARKQAQVEQDAKAEEIRREQEVRAQENMPKNGKVIVEFTGEALTGYGAVLRPVGGQDTFVVYCNAIDSNHNTNPSCKQLKRAKTYGVAKLIEENGKTYPVGPQVFGTLQVKEPSDSANAEKTEITYAVVGGNIAQGILAQRDLVSCPIGSCHKLDACAVVVRCA
jgi:hypothetical protein